MDACNDGITLKLSGVPGGGRYYVSVPGFGTPGFSVKANNIWEAQSALAHWLYYKLDLDPDGEIDATEE